MADEPMPDKELLETLEEDWDPTKDKPYFMLRDSEDERLRVNLDEYTGDIVIFSIDSMGVEDIQRGNWTYKDTKAVVRIEIRTFQNYQRLMNIFAELRKQCYNNKHSMTNYQLIRFTRFAAELEDTYQYWKGTMIVSLESAGITAE